jgi:hypothetical protein
MSKFFRINIAFLRIAELKSVTKAEKFANGFTSNTVLTRPSLLFFTLHGKMFYHIRGPTI